MISSGLSLVAGILALAFAAGCADQLDSSDRRESSAAPALNPRSPDGALLRATLPG